MKHAAISMLNNDLRNRNRSYLAFLNNTSRCYEVKEVEGFVAVRRIDDGKNIFCVVNSNMNNNEFLIRERIFTFKDIASRVFKSLLATLNEMGVNKPTIVMSVTGNHSSDRSYQLMTITNVTLGSLEATEKLREALLKLNDTYPSKIMQSFTVSSPALLESGDDLYKLDNRRSVGSVLNAIPTTGLPCLITLPKIKLGYLKVSKPKTRSQTDTVLLHDEYGKPLFAKDKITADAIMLNDKPYIMFQYSCIRDDATEGGSSRKIIFGFRLLNFLDEVNEPLLKVFD